MTLGNLIDRKSLFKILRNSLVLCVLLFFIQLGTVFSLYDDNVNDYKTGLELINSTEGKDLNLMCNVVRCQALVYEGNIYVSVNGIIELANHYDVKTELFITGLNKDLDTIIDYDGIIFIVNNDKFINVISTVITISTLILFILFFVMSAIIIISETKRNIMEKSILKNNLESRLQRDMTESLHHEMGTPIAVIRTLVQEIFKVLYPCAKTKNKICQFKTHSNRQVPCDDCPREHLSNNMTKQITPDFYEKIMLNIDSLNALQNIVGDSKHIKYSNGTVSLLEIINNVISSNNCSKVNKLEAVVRNNDILDYYACGKGLQNGEMLLVLNAMLNNSIEAKATKIEIRTEATTEPSMIYILVKDNGRGVRNSKDEIVKDINIFNYGYSTKSKNSEDKGIVSKVLDKIFNFQLLSSMGERGVGLSVNKRILMRSGGDIILDTTSELGTTFRLKIPVKVRKK